MVTEADNRTNGDNLKEVRQMASGEIPKEVRQMVSGEIHKEVRQTGNGEIIKVTRMVSGAIHKARQTVSGEIHKEAHRTASGAIHKVVRMVSGDKLKVRPTVNGEIIKVARMASGEETLQNNSITIIIGMFKVTKDKDKCTTAIGIYNQAIQWTTTTKDNIRTVKDMDNKVDTTATGTITTMGQVRMVNKEATWTRTNGNNSLVVNSLHQATPPIQINGLSRLVQEITHKVRWIQLLHQTTQLRIKTNGHQAQAVMDKIKCRLHPLPLNFKFKQHLPLTFLKITREIQAVEAGRAWVVVGLGENNNIERIMKRPLKQRIVF